MTHLRQLPVSKDMASQNLIHHSRFHRAFWSICWTGNTTYSTIATCLLNQPGNSASTCWRCGFKPGGGHFNCVNIGFPMDTLRGIDRTLQMKEVVGLKKPGDG